MKLYLTKEITLNGGPCDGRTIRIPPDKTRISLTSENLNDRLVYEFDHTDKAGNEVFALATREPVTA